MNQREKRLAKVDLNQLVALQTLMEERSVTRAAHKLFLTQSAMSKTLKRMRDFFGDVLFLRSPQGLVPTPRMEELSVSINRALEQLEQSIFTPAFDPATATGNIHISVSDILALKVIPDLVRIRRAEAPEVRLRTSDSSGSNLDLLASGEVDFAIDTEEVDDSDFETTELECFSPFAWVRRDHPLVNRMPIWIDDCTSFPKVVVYRASLNDPAGLSLRLPKSDLNSKLNSGRIFNTTHLLTAVEIMLGGDAIMFGPDYIGHSLLLKQSLAALEVKGLDALRLRIRLIQHRRTLKSPLHAWMRDKIVGIYRKTE